jgi:hypothetical protein
MVFELQLVLKKVPRTCRRPIRTAYMAIHITGLCNRKPSLGGEDEIGKVEHLCYEIFQRRKAARRRFVIARLLLWMGIGASVLGAVNPTIEWLAPDFWTSVLAGMPGVVLLLMHIFKYDARAESHKRKQRRLEAVYKGLVFDGGRTKDASALLTIQAEESKNSSGRRGREPPC